MNREFINKLNQIEYQTDRLLSLSSSSSRIHAKKMLNRWYPTRRSFIEMLNNPSKDRISFTMFGRRYKIPVSYKDSKDKDDIMAAKKLSTVMSSLIKEEEDTLKQIMYESKLIPQFSDDLDKVDWKIYIVPRILLAMCDNERNGWFENSTRQCLLICDCKLDSADPVVIFFENETIVHCSQLSDLDLTF